MKVLYKSDFRECSDKELMCKVSERTEDSMNENMAFDDFVQSLTPAKKRFALQVIELYKRDKAAGDSVVKVTCSNHIYRIMYPHLYDVKVEEFWAIFMTNAAKPIAAKRISIGGMAACLVDVKVVLKEALLCGACTMAVVHNHPSGNSRPSADDDRITDKLKQACDVCNIKLLDHIVFAQDTYYSYADEGKL